MESLSIKLKANAQGNALSRGSNTAGNTPANKQDEKARKIDILFKDFMNATTVWQHSLARSNSTKKQPLTSRQRGSNSKLKTERSTHKLGCSVFCLRRTQTSVGFRSRTSPALVGDLRTWSKNVMRKSWVLNRNQSAVEINHWGEREEKQFKKCQTRMRRRMPGVYLV